MKEAIEKLQEAFYTGDETRTICAKSDEYHFYICK